MYYVLHINAGLKLIHFVIFTEIDPLSSPVFRWFGDSLKMVLNKSAMGFF